VDLGIKISNYNSCYSLLRSGSGRCARLLANKQHGFDRSIMPSLLLEDSWSNDS